MGTEPDFQRLLPAAMRTGWAVVPRFFLYQLAFVGSLLGGGLALSIVGWATGDRWLPMAFPIALAARWLQNRLLARNERRRVRAAGPNLPASAVRP